MTKELSQHIFTSFRKEAFYISFIYQRYDIFLDHSRFLSGITIRKDHDLRYAPLIRVLVKSKPNRIEVGGVCFNYRELIL